MSLKLAAVTLLLVEVAASGDTSFIFNGFQSSQYNLTILAELTSNGLLKLTNGESLQEGHAVYSSPVVFKNSSNNGSAFSFSTSFVFAIRPQAAELSGQGIMFVVYPATKSLTGLPSQYFGVFDPDSVGNSSNHVFGVELDTSMSTEFEDINDNHVGIDINDLKSAASAVAGYHNDDGIFNALRLASGNPIQVWLEYHGMNKQINVTLAPINIDKPKQALLSFTKDLSPILEENMYVGFSSSTGMGTASQYILGWSFEINGQSQPLELSQLPKLPRKGDNKHKGYKKVVLAVALPMISLMLVLLVTLTVNHVIKRKRFSEQLEDWAGNMVDDLIGVRADVEDLIAETCDTNINRYISDKSRLKNKKSLAELFVEFLRKFAQMDSWASKMGISPHTGQWEQIKDNTRWLPKTYAIFVEDPFEQPQNTARSVSSGHLPKIAKAFLETYSILISKSQTPNSLLIYLAPPHVTRYITKPAIPNYGGGYLHPPQPQVPRLVRPQPPPQRHPQQLPQHRIQNGSEGSSSNGSISGGSKGSSSNSSMSRALAMQAQKRQQIWRPRIIQ